MSPFTIDEEKFKTQTALDLSKPQGTVTGIPVKQIPHLEYPRVVYKHPKEPFRTVQHRNLQHEVVHEEILATEHLSKLVQDEGELAAALKDGWVKEPYIPQSAEDPNARIYDVSPNAAPPATGYVPQSQTAKSKK